jgi:hypothetical protein
MLQMKTVAMREQNWLKILEPLAKIKNGAARVAEEDQCIHHADVSVFNAHISINYIFLKFRLV